MKWTAISKKLCNPKNWIGELVYVHKTRLILGIIIGIIIGVLL